MPVFEANCPYCGRHFEAEGAAHLVRAGIEFHIKLHHPGRPVRFKWGKGRGWAD